MVFQEPKHQKPSKSGLMLSTGVGTRRAVVDNFDLITLSLNLTFSELRPPKTKSTTFHFLIKTKIILKMLLFT